VQVLQRGPPRYAAATAIASGTIVDALVQRNLI
jgi:hypothetical protein